MNSDIVSIRELHCANENNPRGKTTFEWRHQDGRQITVYYRKYGNTSELHFHKGEDPSKDPEYFLLLSGELEFYFQTTEGEEGKFVVSAIEGAPQEIIIPPYVLHQITPLTDICYVEYRSTLFDPNSSDCYTKEEFMGLREPRT